jgi:ABC-type antimicrobial peptide transport system permease subunit
VGIIGAAIGTAVCYFTAALISSLTLAHTVSYALPIRIVLKPLCASCIAIIAAVSLHSKMSALDPRLATLVAIFVCAVIYFALYLAAELALVKKKHGDKK